MIKSKKCELGEFAFFAFYFSNEIVNEVPSGFEPL
jgi:hypothetical protein